MSLKQYALISVWNKEGVESIARAMVDRGFDLLSTGQTKKALEQFGFSVTEVSQFTGEPERFGGRVKTLHHKILGGILFRPEQDEKEWPFDFRIGAVVCNFYPFEEKALFCQNLGELAEWVDIGGPTMVRAAAKNSDHVWVLTRPDQYSRFISSLPSEEASLKQRFALQAFQEVSQLDQLIESHWTWRLVQRVPHGELRYGENPHQKAKFIVRATSGNVFHGEMSFNNIRDSEAALRFVREFRFPAVSVVKHQTLCGAAAGLELSRPGDVFRMAWEGDPVSRYGGVLAFNFLPTDEITELLLKKFIEVLVIPRGPKSLAWAEAFRQQKDKVRIIEVDFQNLQGRNQSESIEGALGKLQQESDVLEEAWQVGNETELLRAVGIWSAACSKSNAMTLCGVRGGVAFLAGAGQGQPNRVDALKLLAIPRARDFAQRMELRLEDFTCFSDAFLPFSDCIDVLKEAGVRRLLQPGGSKNDDEVSAHARAQGVEMKIHGTRHFWH